MEKADILMYLLVVFWALALHTGFMWRDYFAGRLRLDLLILECELLHLAALLPPMERRELSDFFDLLFKTRRNAGTVIFSRLLLAWLILPGKVKAASSCHRLRLEALPSIETRRQAVAIYDRFEDAVARKVIAGSPLYWVTGVSRFVLDRFSAAPSSARVRPAHRVPGIELLDATLPNQKPLKSN